MSDREIIEAILIAEGWPKFTNDPDDRGGPTKGGITLATLAAWRGKAASAGDVESLTHDEACAIYRRRYIEDPRFDKINSDDLRAQVVDAGVLHGVDDAAKWLQAIAGVKTDGDFGPVSQQAINAMSPRKVGLLFGIMRVCYMGSIISQNYKARAAGKSSQDQSKYAGGWLVRATSFLKELA